MFQTELLIVVAATFLLAGTVKGVIGLGLPTVSLGILTAAFDLPTAMVLLLAPSFVTNLWQGVVGGHGREILERIWPFLLSATVTIPVGALALSYLNLSWLAALLGILLVAYGALSLLGVRPALSRQHEPAAGVAFGFVNGVLTGMTGSFVVPGVMYLQALGLSRDALIQAMGIVFTLSTVMLAVSLGGHDVLARDLVWLSAFGVFPALAGMMLGQWLRAFLSEQLFRRIFFLSLLILGGYIVWGATMRLAAGSA